MRDQLDAIAGEYGGVKARDGYTIRCPLPSHGKGRGDRRQSCSIWLDHEGEIGVDCKAGCDNSEVRRVLGISKSGSNDDRIVAKYGYMDEEGELLYQVVRLVPKDFRQRKPDGNGGWVWKLGDTRRVLYHARSIPWAIERDREVHLCEGEKDADAVRKAGGVGTTNAGGAKSWRREYTQALEGARVVIVQDRDEAGRERGRKLLRELEGVAKEVRLLEPAMGKDASEHLAAGYGLDDFVEVAPPSEPAQEPGRLLDGAHLTPLASIEREEVHWLWPDRVPLGMLTLLIGDPGLGKSLLTLLLAAWVSRAGGDVLILSAEDHAGATIRPRAEALEADLDRLHIVGMRRDRMEDGLALPDDAAELDRVAEETGARLVIVDPLMAHLPEAVNSWRDQSVRRALAPLHRLAEQRASSVVVVAHLNKARGADPLYRAGGSIGIPAAVRSALLLARDPEDPDAERGNQRVLAHIKCNVAPQAESLACRIDPVSLPGDEQVVAPRLRITGTSTTSASDLLDAPDSMARTERDEAADFLRAELAEGPRPVKEIRHAARDVGMADRTLDRAKANLGVKTKRVEGVAEAGHWEWFLSTPRLSTPPPYISGGALSENCMNKPETDGPQPLSTPHSDMASLREVWDYTQDAA